MTATPISPRHCLRQLYLALGRAWDAANVLPDPRERLERCRELNGLLASVAVQEAELCLGRWNPSPGGGLAGFPRRW